MQADQKNISSLVRPCPYPEYLSLLLFILCIDEICPNGHQSIQFRPIPRSLPFFAKPPVLSILRLRQVERLRSHVGWCKCNNHVSVLSSFGWWTRRLVFDHTVGPALQPPRRCKRHVRDNPVAHLAPFGIFSRRRVWICHGDRILQI